MTEDEMVGWHHRLDGYGFGWTLGVDKGQGGLACCSPWGRKESDMTERLNCTEPSSALSALSGSASLPHLIHQLTWVALPWNSPVTPPAPAWATPLPAS